MLQVQFYSDLQQKQSLFAKMDPRSDTWLVADLRSKLGLQRELVERFGFVEEEAVWRASDLWQHWLRILVPEINVVSKDFAKAFIRSELSSHREEWKHRPGVVDIALSYLENFSSVLSHTDGHAVLTECFQRHSEASWKWKGWYELSRELWQSFLAKNILPVSFLSGVLLHQEDLAKAWQRNLVVDLGGHITPVEVDLLLRVSENTSVTVLCPENAWTDDYRELLEVYRPLLNKTSPVSQGSEEKSKTPKDTRPKTWVKYSTMISEVKAVTAQVRRWLEEGFQPWQILVTAPDIEVYWPSLSLHLQKEGIPVSKKVVTRYHSLPSVTRWISDLRLQLGETRYSDLESRFYGGVAQIGLPYAEFERLFLSIYGKDDLHRSDEVKKHFEAVLDPHQKKSLQEFTAWALKFWPVEFLQEDHLSPLEKVCFQLFQEASGVVDLPSADWLSYLESVVSRLEIDIEPGREDGIQVARIFSAEVRATECLALMGLTDQSLRPSVRGGLSAGDAQWLAQETGFRFSTADGLQMEFDGRWLVEESSRQVVASFPATDFSGQPQAPSLLWLKEKLKKGESSEEMVVPADCRWDELQKGLEFSGASWLQSIDELSKFLSFEMGGPLPPDWSEVPERGVSATGLELYRRCPFQYAASRLFGLTDLPTVDLDVDRMTRGRLMHALFDRLLDEKKKLRFSDEDILQAIDQSRESEELVVADERLWPPMRNRYLQQARQFLRFEREWREKFPKTQTVGREEKVRGWIDARTGQLSKADEGTPSKDESKFHFRGSIDRVDVNGHGQAVVVDYKSSKGSLRQHGSWVKNNQLQLGLYAQALENGLTSIDPQEVSSAVYYVAKRCERGIGYQVKEQSGDLFDVQGARGSVLDQPGKERLLNSINEVVSEVLQAMQAGRFQPQPRTRKDCETCRWRTLCRAPHLN